MTQQFKVGQTVKTKGGYDAEILKTDAAGDCPIVAYVVLNNKRSEVITCTGSGVYNPREECGSVFDLIPPEPKLTGFINVDADGCQEFYTTREKADAFASDDRTHCIDLSDLTEEQLRKWRVED